MKKIFPMVICILLFMSSCSTSPVELTATANIVLQQTQTAAPTKTPTLTLTPTPTLTPTTTPTPLGGGGVIAFVSNGIALYNIDTGETSYPTIQFKEKMDSTFGVESVSMSPDGTKLAFTQSLCPTKEPGQNMSYCRRDLFSSNVDGSNVFQFAHTSVDEDWPVWSPDSTRIAYVSDTSGRAEIYVVSADGSNKIRLTDAPGWDWSPTWSPEGKKIAFQSQRNGSFQIYVMNVDRSGDAIQLTKIKGALSVAPSWSPGGSKISFVVFNTKSKTSDIYIMDADGSNQTNITAGKYNTVSYPTWSPDGNLIAFKCNEHICTMYPDGSGITELINLTGIDSKLSWFLH